MDSYVECKAIAELDLDPIKSKLMHKESGEAWTQARADAAEAEYRRFLYLTKTFPREVLAPQADVDTFWHYHILDTMRYARDCEAVFGYFLHHFPYVGLGENEKATREKLALRMRVLYEETFGELPAVLQPAISPAVVMAYCAAPGKPGTLTAAGHAYCAAPGLPAGHVPARQLAYCAAPGQPEGSYCAAPGQPDSANTNLAYCAAPALPLSAAKMHGVRMPALSS